LDYADVNCISLCTFLEILRDFKKVHSSEGGGKHFNPVQEHVQISFSERACDVIAECVEKRTMHVNKSFYQVQWGTY
jgi:hypothetical protein